jgi:anaerobic C4-dicarboxylate transporter
MKTGWRFALAVVAWALSIPVMGIIGSWLKRSAFRSVEAEIVMAHTIEVVLVLLAALIYWRCVPHASDLGRRVLYLAGFVVLMVVVGYCALGASIVLVTVLFGL